MVITGKAGSGRRHEVLGGGGGAGKFEERTLTWCVRGWKSGLMIQRVLEISVNKHANKRRGNLSLSGKNRR